MLLRPRPFSLRARKPLFFALLELAKQLSEARSPSGNPATPSGMIPTYQKPTSKNRKKTPGAKLGHEGSRRAAPAQIDHKKEHRAEQCPDCGSRLKECSETRTRYTEDIPETKPETTEHTIHRDWCPQCNKKVEPQVTDALPGSTLGLRVLVLSAWLRMRYCVV
jgi:transposase